MKSCTGSATSKRENQQCRKKLVL
ncbi:MULTISPECIES: hypothetical protein [Acinetobacter]